MYPQNSATVCCPAPSLTALGEAGQKKEYSNKHRIRRSEQSQEGWRTEHLQLLLKVFLLSVWVDKVGDLCHVPALDVTICLTVSCIHLLCFIIEREVSKTLCGVQGYSSSVVCSVQQLSHHQVCFESRTSSGCQFTDEAWAENHCWPWNQAPVLSPLHSRLVGGPEETPPPPPKVADA